MEIFNGRNSGVSVVFLSEREIENGHPDRLRGQMMKETLMIIYVLFSLKCREMVKFVIIKIFIDMRKDITRRFSVF